HRRLRLRLVDRAPRGHPATPATGLVTFEDHVQRALDSLPEDLARGLENVAVVIEDEHPERPNVFGLFERRPYLPAKVTIYRRPLEETFRDPERLEREIRITVLHE